MSYVDVLFPLAIGPLTYRCPAHLEASALPGMLVSTPLRKGFAKGIIIGRTSSPPQGRLREIAEVLGEGPLFSREMLKLLRWMSEYYLVPEGIVLKTMLPKEYFSRAKARRTTKTSLDEREVALPSIIRDDIQPFLESASRPGYRTFLLHAPSTAYEYGAAAAIAQAVKGGVLILLPEVSQAGLLHNALRELLGEKVCMLHGEMSAGRRSESIEGIIGGRHSVVVGTRTALFAPLRALSLIILLHEQSGSYKLEEATRCHVRDVSVMRGFFENCTVLLSSVAPSIDSFHNALSGKYSLISPPSEEVRPRIRIVDTRYKKKTASRISRPTADAARKVHAKGKDLLFYVNRRGYAPLLLCPECGHTESCENCSIPMSLHRQGKSLRCHYCGAERSIPDRCPRCGGASLDVLGAGTERVEEEIAAILGADAIRIDSDLVKKGAEIGDILGGLSAVRGRVVVGTKLMTSRVGEREKFALIAAVTIDTSLNLPDFRANEKAYAELAGLRELLEPGGELIIQTRFPGHSLFRHFRASDYASFADEELRVRKELGYPPYAKLINLTFSRETAAEKAAETLRRFGGGVEVLGPAASRGRKGKNEFSVLLRSRDRKALRQAARQIMAAYGGRKEIEVVIDVDPL